MKVLTLTAFALLGLSQPGLVLEDRAERRDGEGQQKQGTHRPHQPPSDPPHQQLLERHKDSRWSG